MVRLSVLAFECILMRMRLMVVCSFGYRRTDGCDLRPLFTCLLRNRLGISRNGHSSSDSWHSAI